jgi:hypothetical protein
MRPAMRQLSVIRCVTAFGAAACLLLGAAAGAAQAGTAGILPPRNPASDCDHTNAGGGYWSVTNINSCRALEGVGPLTLPTNWNTLTPVEQGFVLIDLERVNRGLAPIVGLSPALNRLAADGAANDADPSFPTGGFGGGGAIWAGVGSVLAADYLWMYDDGANGLDTNLACPSAGAPGCWGHRDIILWNRGAGQLVAGGGYAGNSDGGSFAYLVLSGYSTAGLSFAWSGELRYFAVRPTLEHTGRAAVATEPHKRKAAKRHPVHRRTKRHQVRKTVKRHAAHGHTKHHARHRRKHARHKHARHKHARHKPTNRTESSSPTSSDSSPTISFG